ncbi:MAG: ERF family protein [Culicoidibacterales bacterium]
METKLASALLIFRDKIESVKKDANNPFFKSKYADLSSILE